MKTILCLALLGLIASVSYATVTPSNAAFTSTAFASAPVKVFDYANATTGTPDAGITGTAVWTQGVIFGPGSDNKTIYVWAVKYASLAISGVIKRTLNATAAAMGTGTAEEAVLSADATATLAATLTYAPVMATAPGFFAIVGNVAGTMKVASTDILTLWTIAGSGSSATTVTVDTSAATTATNYFTWAVNSIWSEDGVFYILYETQKQAGGTAAAATAWSGATSVIVTGLNLQGYNTSSSKLMYTATVSVAGTLAITTTTISYAPLTSAVGAGNNYSMSTSIQILYKDPTSGSAKLYYVAVAKTAGTAGSVSTVGTDVTQSTTVAGATYTAGGFIGSNYTYGFAIANATQAAAATAGATTYGIMADLNGSTTAGTAAYAATQNQLAIATGSNGALTLKGFPYSLGFATLISTPQSGATSGPAYSILTYYANGTVNGSSTATALGSSLAPISTFVDVNGGVWLGYYSYDTQTTVANGPTTGYIGRVVTNVNYYNATATKAANVLATFAAILSFVIASLFMF